jgi:hypothetical protein
VIGLSVLAVILVSGGYPAKEMNRVQRVHNPFRFTPHVA